MQSVTGSLKFSERVHTRLKLPVHRLGCVQSSPVDVKLALKCALSVLAMIWPHRMEGRMWHPHRAGRPRMLAGSIHAEDFELKDGSPSELEAHADFSNGARQVIGELVTFNGAAVAASTTTLKAKALSTMEGELGGTPRVLTRTEYGRIVARALGVPPEGATFIGTDNLAHLLVATHKGSASRARHLLVRYIQTKQAIARGECVLGHVPDAQMPADHLTKWVTKEKLEASIAYANGTTAAIAPVMASRVA